MSKVNQQEMQMLETVEEIVARYPDRTGQLISILNDIQEQYRYLPEEALKIVNEKTGIPLERMLEMGKFFKSLSIDPIGKFILEVCDGTACHAAGAPRLIQAMEEKLGIKEGETTLDGMITLRKVHCVGACGLAPVILAEEKAFGRVKLTETAKIINIVQQEAQVDE